MTVFRSKAKVGAGFAIYQYSGNDDPLTDPLHHIPALRLHSDFDYYAAAAGFPQDVTVAHASIAADTGEAIGNPATVQITYFYAVTQNDYVLAAHNLGYKPNFMVSVGGVQYPVAFPVQRAVGGARRSVMFWVDNTNIYVREYCIPGNVGLPAVNVTYHVTVFRDPTASGTHLMEATASRIRLAYGKFDTNERMAREPDTGETVYNVPTDRTCDINNGHFRFILPDGSFYQLAPIFGFNSYLGTQFVSVPAKGIAI